MLPIAPPAMAPAASPAASLTEGLPTPETAAGTGFPAAIDGTTASQSAPESQPFAVLLAPVPADPALLAMVPAAVPAPDAATVQADTGLTQLLASIHDTASDTTGDDELLALLAAFITTAPPQPAVPADHEVAGAGSSAVGTILPTALADSIVGEPMLTAAPAPDTAAPAWPVPPAAAAAAEADTDAGAIIAMADRSAVADPDSSMPSAVQASPAAVSTAPAMPFPAAAAVMTLPTADGQPSDPLVPVVAGSMPAVAPMGAAIGRKPLNPQRPETGEPVLATMPARAEEPAGVAMAAPQPARPATAPAAASEAMTEAPAAATPSPADPEAAQVPTDPSAAIPVADAPAPALASVPAAAVATAAPASARASAPVTALAPRVAAPVGPSMLARSEPQIAPEAPSEQASAAQTAQTVAAPTDGASQAIGATARTEQPAPALRSESAQPSSHPNPLDRAVAHQVSRAIVQHLPDGGARMVMRLTPPELGTVRIEFIARDGMVTARLMADDEGVRQALDRALPHIRADVRADHPSVDITVDRSDQRHAWGEGHARQERRDEPRTGQGRRQREDDPVFAIEGAEPVAVAAPVRAAPQLGGRVGPTLVDALA